MTRQQHAKLKRPKVLVIGGTGFIGFHIVQALLNQAVQVTIFSRDPEKAKIIFSEHPSASQLHYLKGDIDLCSEVELVGVLQVFDKLVFSAGVDERVEPEGDAYEFFKKANVDSCEKLFRAAQLSKVTHAVLLSSIFLNLARMQPELKLAEKHPYIRSRIEQNDVSQALAKDHFVLTTIEVPWVFGVSPHRESQWKSLITYARIGTPLLSCRGGVNVVAVQSIGEAVAGALLYPHESSLQTIGDLNMTHEEMMLLLCEYSNRRQEKITLVSDNLMVELMRAGGFFKDLLGMQSGLDIHYLPELLTQEIYVDNAGSKLLLGYSTGKAREAIQETVRSIPENTLMKGWRKLRNTF